MNKLKDLSDKELDSFDTDATDLDLEEIAKEIEDNEYTVVLPKGKRGARSCAEGF